MEIIGSVSRFEDPMTPLIRFDTHGVQVETYTNISFKGNENNDFIKQHYNPSIHDDLYLVSKNNKNEITDYYLFTDSTITRYDESGQLKGDYICGNINLLNNYNHVYSSVFIEKLKNYYKDKLFSFENVACIVKNFGNRAVYIIYQKI